jgi:hypothetical protein
MWVLQRREGPTHLPAPQCDDDRAAGGLRHATQPTHSAGSKPTTGRLEGGYRGTICVHNTRRVCGGSRDEGCLSEGELEWQAADFFREDRARTRSDPRPQVVRHPTRSAVRMEEPAGPADRCQRALMQERNHLRNQNACIFHRLADVAEGQTRALAGRVSEPLLRCRPWGDWRWIGLLTRAGTRRGRAIALSSGNARRARSSSVEPRASDLRVTRAHRPFVSDRSQMPARLR